MKKSIGWFIIAIPFVWVMAEGARKIGWPLVLEASFKFFGALACVFLGVYLILVSDDK